LLYITLESKSAKEEQCKINVKTVINRDFNGYYLSSENKVKQIQLRNKELDGLKSEKNLNKKLLETCIESESKKAIFGIMDSVESNDNYISLIQLLNTYNFNTIKKFVDLMIKSKTDQLLTLTDKINISTFLIFLLLSYTFLTSLKTLMQFAGTFSFVLAGANNVRSMIEFPIQNDGKNLKDINFKEDISFIDVTFSYDKNDVLKNINLILKPNTITALVGPSGSGKTTIAYLLGRFWDIQKGSIKIGDIDIKDIDVNYLLSNISYVFQDIFMLTDTIFENIKMGLDKTKEEVYQAAKDAEIHEFIMSLPNGYDTIIGDGYIKLSGGEKQRISIARCLLKNSPIVILDEITAYSDIENEAKIQSAIRNLLKDKTAIIIAHRLYTIKDVDNIVVLNEGEIVESGKHQDLITKENGLYKHLWEVK